MTPLGWSRANLLYDSLTEPPEPGSLREVVLTLVQQARVEQDFNRTMVLIAKDPEMLQSAVEGYTKAMFPYASGFTKEEVTNEMRGIMERIHAEGPIVIVK
jgi:acyl transferase domain-containing protein